MENQLNDLETLSIPKQKKEKETNFTKPLVISSVTDFVHGYFNDIIRFAVNL